MRVTSSYFCGCISCAFFKNVATKIANNIIAPSCGKNTNRSSHLSNTAADIGNIYIYYTLCLYTSSSLLIDHYRSDIHRFCRFLRISLRAMLTTQNIALTIPLYFYIYIRYEIPRLKRTYPYKSRRSNKNNLVGQIACVEMRRDVCACNILLGISRKQTPRSYNVCGPEILLSLSLSPLSLSTLSLSLSL